MPLLVLGHRHRGLPQCNAAAMIDRSIGGRSGMTPNEFIAKWRGGGNERAAVQRGFCFSRSHIAALSGNQGG